jgi:hypothetical protein
MLCLLSRRIVETGNKELAEAALTLASASHDYIPEREKVLKPCTPIGVIPPAI